MSIMYADSKNNNLAVQGRNPLPSNSHPSWPENVPIPESFLCALSKLLMKDPVIDREGNSYEKGEILAYLRQGRGHSPVTQNPLCEADLVDNKGLQMAIDAAMKNAIEKEDNNKSRRKTRKMRIPNPLSASMKAFRKSTVSDNNFAEESQGPKNVPSNDYLLKTAGSSEEATTQLEEIKKNKTPQPNYTAGKRITRQRVKPGIHDSINTGDAGLDANVAAFIQAGQLGTSTRNITRKTSSESQTSQLAEIKEVEGNGENDYKSEQESADAKFEARLRRKLSQDDSHASAVYVPRSSSEYDERLSRKLSELSEASKRRMNEYKKQGSVNATNLEQGATDSHEIANYPPKRKNATSHESNDYSVTRDVRLNRTSNGAKDRGPRRPSVDDSAVIDYKKENLRRSNQDQDKRRSKDDCDINSRKTYKGKRRSASLEEQRISGTGFSTNHVTFANYLPKRKHEPRNGSNHNSVKIEPESSKARGLMRLPSMDDSVLVDYKKESLRQSYESLTTRKSKDDSEISRRKTKASSKERTKSKKSKSKEGKASRPRRTSIDDMVLSDHKRETLRIVHKTSDHRRHRSVSKKRSKSSKRRPTRNTISPDEDARTEAKRLFGNTDADATFEERLARKKLERKNKKKNKKANPTKGGSSPTTNTNGMGELNDDQDKEATYPKAQEEALSVKTKEKSTGAPSRDGKELSRARRSNRRLLLDEKVEQVRASLVSTKDSVGKESSMDKPPGIHPSSISHLDSFEARIIAKNKKFSTGQSPVTKRTSMDSLDSFEARIESKIREGTQRTPSGVPERQVVKNHSKPCILTSLGLSERRLSELTIEEDNKSSHSGTASLDRKSSLSSSGHTREEPMLRRCSSAGNMNRKIPPNNSAGGDSFISWGDLDEEIAEAQHMSMKVTSTDALKLQRELEAGIDRGFDAGEPNKGRHDQRTSDQFLSKRRVSDLTIEEDSESNHGMRDSLVQAVLSSLDDRQSESKIATVSKSNRKLPPTVSQTAADYNDSAISWGDLDGEIAEAQYLSMKVSNQDALVLQAELEAGIDTNGPTPSDDGGRQGRGGGGPAVSQRKPRGRRGQKEITRQDSETPSIQDKADAIMPIVAGTNKTRNDVLIALKTMNGDEEKAVGMLMGFGESFFGS